MLKLFCLIKLVFFMTLRDAISKQHQQSVIDLNVYFWFLLRDEVCLKDQSFQVLPWSMS